MEIFSATEIRRSKIYFRHYSPTLHALLWANSVWNIFRT